MMGKIEEVYRLPLLPMRRDTRSKLQKIVMEVGLIAKPAAPAPKRRNSTSMKTGRRDRIRSCCTGDRAANAATAKAVPPATTPITRAGMARTRRCPRPVKSAHAMTGVLIRSECKCV